MKKDNHKSILSHKANDHIQHIKIKIIDILDIIMDPQNKHKIKNNIESMIKGILYITYKHIKKEIIISNKGIYNKII
jgi:hypothetical protein